MIEKYLDILTDSMEKKIVLLNQIILLNKKQSKILSEDPINLEVYDECVDVKDEHIQELLKLDEGFEHTYDRIASEISTNKDAYAAYIVKLQEQISNVMELSMTVQAQEARNKTSMEDMFRREKEKLGSGRKTSKAALDYYKSASRSTTVTPQFLDKKK